MHSKVKGERGIRNMMEQGRTSLRGAVRGRFPFLGPEVTAGCYAPHDGHANPRLAAPAFGRAAVREGARTLAVGVLSRAGGAGGVPGRDQLWRVSSSAAMLGGPEGKASGVILRRSAM